MGATPSEVLKSLGIESGTELLDRGGSVLKGVNENFINIEKIAQDTIRQGATTIDNTRSDLLSTGRQFGSDAAAIIDSAIDNVNTTVNTVSVAFFDTIQIITLLVFGGVMFFLLFYGDKIFANGIRLGKINLI